MKKYLLLFPFSVFILCVSLCPVGISESYGSPAPAQDMPEQAPAQQETQPPAAASAPKTYAKPRVLVS